MQASFFRRRLPPFIERGMRDLLRIVFRDRRWPLRGESGHRLLFRPSEQPSLLKGIKRFEPDIREEWKVLLAPGDVIFDVGANIGLTVDRFWGLLGGACTIWAFEPLPRNLELLRPNARQLSTTAIHVVPVALGNSDGDALFEDNLLFGASGRLAGVARGPVRDPAGKWRAMKHVTVPLLTLETFSRDHPEAVPTFIKLDVEGAGHLVLEGAMGLLARSRPTLSCSFHGAEEINGIRRIAQELGYVGVRLDHNGRLVQVPIERSRGAFVHPAPPDRAARRNGVS